MNILVWLNNLQLVRVVVSFLSLPWAFWFPLLSVFWCYFFHTSYSFSPLQFLFTSYSTPPFNTPACAVWRKNAATTGNAENSKTQNFRNSKIVQRKLRGRDKGWASPSRTRPQVLVNPSYIYFPFKFHTVGLRGFLIFSLWKKRMIKLLMVWSRGRKRKEEGKGNWKLTCVKLQVILFSQGKE